MLVGGAGGAPASPTDPQATRRAPPRSTLATCAPKRLPSPPPAGRGPRTRRRAAARRISGTARALAAAAHHAAVALVLLARKNSTNVFALARPSSHVPREALDDAEGGARLLPVPRRLDPVLRPVASWSGRGKHERPAKAGRHMRYPRPLSFERVLDRGDLEAARERRSTRSLRGTIRMTCCPSASRSRRGRPRYRRPLHRSNSRRRVIRRLVPRLFPAPGCQRGVERKKSPRARASPEVGEAANGDQGPPRHVQPATRALR